MIDNRELSQVRFSRMAAPHEVGKRRVTVYWLMPAPPHCDVLREFVAILATQFHAPTFEPHLTICRANLESPTKKLREIRFAPVRLRVFEVSQSSKFTQTLIVRFHRDR